MDLESFYHTLSNLGYFSRHVVVDRIIAAYLPAYSRLTYSAIDYYLLIL
jgi:hypothetical protein